MRRVKSLGLLAGYSRFFTGRFLESAGRESDFVLLYAQPEMSF